MTLRELRKLLDTITRDDYLDREVKVWLPGSRISLVPKNLFPCGEHMLLEGNIDAGSVLTVEVK